MAKFKFGPIVDSTTVVTARTADGTGDSNQLTDLDVNKLMRLKGDSQYGLCAVGDMIEGQLVTPNYPAKADGYNLGGVATDGRIRVTLDGLQATPGTGVIAVGDFVVAGTVVARGTALGTAYPKVCKATDATTHAIRWRVVALDGTTAVGQTALIERV